MKPCVFIATCVPLWAQAAIPYGYPFNAMTGEEVVAPVVRRRFPCPKPGKKKR